jgi:hypothetical protein
MKTNRLTLYLTISWILTVGVAYLIGWWVGVKSVTHAATSAAHGGFWLVIALLALVAIGTAVAAYRMRGYFDHRHGAHI